MLKLLAQYLDGYKTQSLIAILSKMVEVAFELITPFVVAAMIDAAQAKVPTSELLCHAGLLLIFAAVSYAATLICQKLAAHVSQGVGTRMRDDLYEAALYLSPEMADAFGASSLLTRTTADVNQIQLALALTLRQVTRWPVLVVGSIGAALSIDLHMGLVFAICLPLVVCAFVVVMRLSIPLLMKIQAGLDRLSLLMRETLSGIRTIRAYRQEQFELGRFNEAVSGQKALVISQGRLSAILGPASFMAMALGLMAILYLGGKRVDAGLLTTGEVVAFVSYMTQALSSISYLASLVMLIMRAHTSSLRIAEVLDGAKSAQIQSDHNKSLALSQEDGLQANNNEQTSQLDTTSTHKDCVLSFKDVSFSYAGAQKPALHDISFSVGANETLAIIGGTGSGKSSLAGLVCGLYQATKGRIEIKNTNITKLDQISISSAVALVPQESSLMSGTIRSNLKWRDVQASDEQLWQALNDAQAKDFVDKLDLQLDAPVEPGGKNFSGGQRQRLCIARALVGTSSLVVLDDSASALDYATEAALRKALATRQQAVAYIIISQRIAQVKDADHILVLDHGKACGYGTHDELLQSCPVYREICELQLQAAKE